MMGLSDGKKISTKRLAILTQNVCDTQTHKHADKHTDRNAIAYTHASTASQG